MNDQPTLFDELDARTHAKRDDPDTSHEAAASLGSKESMQRALLLTYVDVDRTAEEASDVCGFDEARGGHKRVSDLLGKGFIEDTGARRVGTSGRRRMVCQITDKGRRALRDGLNTREGDSST